MPTSAFKKSYLGSITDIIEQQQSFRKKLEFNSGISAAIASMSSITKAYEMAMPKKDILSAVLGNSTLAYIQAAQKQQRITNSLGLGIGITGLAEEMSKIHNIYNRNDMRNIISPMLQIQNSLNTLYKSNSAFANYNKLFNNPSFVGQMKGLQVAITGITGYMAENITIEEDDFDNEHDLETVLNDTSSIAVNITETKTVSYEEFVSLADKIQFIYDYLINKPKGYSIRDLVFLILFSILPLLNDIVQQAQHYYDSKDAVTKKDFQELSDSCQKTMAKIYSMLPKTEVRYAQWPCLLKLKYNTKSQTIYKIKIGQEVTVLTIRGKWLKVSIIDENDEAEITGWVLKKYFKEKQPR